MLFRVFRETRGYTTSNLITTEGLMTWSSEVFRILSSHFLIWKSCKNRKLKEVLCVVFRSLKKTRKSVCAPFTTVCNSSLTHTTYKPSHRSHTIIPLSNHHTIIIPKSHNLRNIYVSKIVWFWYDYGMMVWKWYDCMTSVWWFVRCVCEWRVANSCKGSTHTFSRFLQTPKYHTKHFLKFSVFATFSYQEMTWQYPEDLWRPGH